MLHQIGVGALGPVFRTYEPARDRLVAVKVFRLDITPEQAQALADELARAADAGLFHPSIVEPIAAGVQGTVAYRAEEYMPAESLDVAMRHYAPAPPERVLPIVTQLAGALDFARASGVGHGALHPRDVFVTPEEARVTGFGVVEALERVGLRAPVRRPYSPPERIAGEAWSTPADVFSLAAITYELLTGRRPAGTGLALGEIKEESAGPHAARLVAVLARAMSDRPADRYSGALAFASALEAASRGQGEAPVVSVPAADAPALDETRLAVDAAPAEIPPAGPSMPAASPAASTEPAFADEEVVAQPDRVPTPRQARTRRTPGREAEPPPAAIAEPGAPAAGSDSGARDVEASIDDPVSPPAHGVEAEEQAFALEPGDTATERDEDEAHWLLTREEQQAARLDAAGFPAADPVAADSDRFILDAAEVVLADAAAEPAFASEFKPPVQAHGPPPADATRPARELADDTAAAAAAPAAGRIVPPVAVPPARTATPQSGARPKPDDSFTYDRPLAEELTADSRVFVVQHSRAAMLPLAMALVIGLPLAFAAGYVVRGRSIEPASPAAAVEPAGDAGAPTAGTTYSEQAVEPPPDPVPPAPAPEVPSEPSGAPAPASAAADPGATTGRLVVRSTPSRAAVTVNGRWSGRTPLTLSDLAFGEYVVRVVAEGYRVGREAVTIDRDNASRTIAMRLEREPPPQRPAPRAPEAGAAPSAPASYYGSLYVDSRPQGATVYVGGEPRGKTPLRIPQVPIGSHVVRLELVDHSAWSTVVRVTAGQEARATGSLDPIR